jgi:hypothetical protein
VDQDIRLLGERKWKNFALNGEEWRKLLKKARPKQGCLVSDDNDYIIHYIYINFGAKN